MKKISLALLAVLALSACTFNQTPMINQADLSAVDFAALKNEKKGVACHEWVLGFPISTRASIAKAAWNADISKVEYVENSATSVFPFYWDNCVVAYGK